jgi:cold shock protein
VGLDQAVSVEESAVALLEHYLLLLIVHPEGGEDVFVHHTGIAGNGFKTLEEGNKVSYEATQGKKGMQAENVSRL